MPIEPIRDNRDHEKALARIEALWGAELETPDGAELDAFDPIDTLKTP